MTETGPEGPFAADDSQPTNAMIERARQTAADPDASQDALIGAASLLGTCGIFDAAHQALGRIDQNGPLKSEARKVAEHIKRLEGAPEQYTDSLLGNAIAIARRPNSTDEQLLAAAENLVRWGSLDEADHALSRLRSAASMKSKVARLQAASRQLRRSGILNDLSQLGDTESAVLNRPHEVMVAKREGARRAIMVFTGRGQRMWVTLSVFHQFLRRYDAHIFYLRDNTNHGYLNGLRSVGGDFQNLIATLKKSAADLGAEKIHVMANSSGGFGGLLAALAMRAESFLGFGIRTNLSTAAARRDHIFVRDPKLMINLRSLIEKAQAPPRILLFAGALNELDREEAENLRGAPNVEIELVDGDEGHDTIAALLGRGTFDAALKRFLNEPS